MKRYVIIVAGALSVTAGAALAAMGPTFGLPQGWSITNTRGYGTQAGLNGNPASAMCVECHTVNPSDRILQVSNPAGAGLAMDRTNAAHRGSHFVMNQQAGAANAPWNITNTKGGFTGGFANTGDAADKYEKLSAWTIGGTSKYQNKALTALGNTAAGAGGDMICESCHNIIHNTATNSDNDLLLGTYQDNVDDGICLGCHNQDETLANRGGFHTKDNLPAFAGTTVRKRHHVLTGDTLTDAYYGTTGVSSTMWAPSASNRLSTAWCTTPYGAPGTLIDLDLTVGAAIAFREACNVAGQGSRLNTAVVALGNIAPTGANAINCSNCHRPHNAMSSSGAFLFRMGENAKGDFTGNVGAGKFTGLTNASMYYGLRRQADVDTTYAAKVYNEYRPLCAGCHYGY